VKLQRPNPLQGEIWDIDFRPVVGHEQGGRRPALVISHNAFNAAANELCVVLPLTTRGGRTARAVLPSDIVIDPPEGGVSSRSVVLANQLRTVSHQRLRDRRGAISRQTLHAALNIAVTIISE
jgi:mRNA interferase MazF